MAGTTQAFWQAREREGEREGWRGEFLIDFLKSQHYVAFAYNAHFGTVIGLS
jgi:hypothetical protein